MAEAHHSLSYTSWRAVLAVAAFVLGGCGPSALRPASRIDAQVPQIAIPQRAGLPPRENRLSAATRALVTQARTLDAKGDLDGASAALDRALRIEPNNPLLWVERARLRLAEGDPRQAEGCGRKALALASGDPGAQKLAGRVLVDALRAQNRNPEAQAVESQPFMR